MKNTIPLILITLSIGIFFMYVRPEYEKIGQLRSTQVQYEDAIQKTNDALALRTKLLGDLNAISDADKAKMQAMVPTEFNSTKLISDISSVALRYGMSVRAVKIQENKVSDSSQTGVDASAGSPLPYQTATISFTVTGQYKQFLPFLRDLESSQQLLDIRKLDISSAAGGKVSATSISSPVSVGQNIDFTVTLETYFIN